MAALSPAVPGVKQIALRLLLQSLWLALCIVTALRLAEYLTVCGFFVWLDSTSLVQWLPAQMPANHLISRGLPALAIVVTLMPAVFCLQLLNGHICLTPYEKKHATYFLPLTELFALPVMLVVLLIAFAEVLWKLAKGVTFAEIKRDFPGWGSFLNDWLYPTACNLIPVWRVPVGAVCNTMAFSWLMLVAIALGIGCDCVIKASLFSGLIFAVLCGPVMAFSFKEWDLRNNQCDTIVHSIKSQN